MATRRPVGEFLDDISVAPDGLPCRRAQPWSRDKLGILAMYLPAFASASKRTGCYFVDGLAGEGVYRFGDTDQYLLGSTLIALQTSFRLVLAMDLAPAKATALQSRASRFGDRAVIMQGDCNVDLFPAMVQHLPRGAPLLVFLDPEGFELRWETVAAISGFKTRGTKPELLIFVPTTAVGRVAQFGNDPDDEGVDPPDDVFPPGSQWRHIWAATKRGEIPREQARAELALDYRRGLMALGYKHTHDRAITSGDASAPTRYHLVFATDHDAGIRIMNNCFDRMYSNRARKKGVPPAQRPLRGFGPE